MTLSKRQFVLLALVSLIVCVTLPSEVVANGAPITKLNTGRQYYGHGAVMGAAIDFSNDATWMGILKQLTPNVAQQLVTLKAAVTSAKDATSKSDATSAVMLFMENNPILAAYATVKHCGNFNGPCANPLKYEWDVWTGPNAANDLSRLKIAHGTAFTLASQTVLKTTNIGYSRPEVVAAPTALGWLTQMGQAIDLAKKGGAGTPIAAADAIKSATAYMASPSGLVLDVKSTYSTSAELDSLTATLKANYGIHVFGVGSFIRPQIDGMRGGVTPVHFYHSHFGLLKDGAAGVLRKNDYVMFNAGSLLDTAANGAVTVNKQYFNDLSQLQTLFSLHIALYVQEPRTSPQTADVLVQLTNANPGTITDGFAYGNLNGVGESFAIGNGQGGQSQLITTERLSLAASKVIGQVETKIATFFQNVLGRHSSAAAPPSATAPPTKKVRFLATEPRVLEPLTA